MADILKDSELNNVAGGAASASTYTVKKGDTLTSIAHKHGTTWRLLFALNEDLIVGTCKARGIEVKKYEDYANFIFPGQVLRLR